MGATVVENVRFGVIISLPLLKLKALRESRFADDPELTISAYFLPNIFATFFSKIFT
jgi:hypothetical protein